MLVSRMEKLDETSMMPPSHPRVTQHSRLLPTTSPLPTINHSVSTASSRHLPTTSTPNARPRPTSSFGSCKQQRK